MGQLQTEIESQFFGLVKVFFSRHITGPSFVIDVIAIYNYNRADLEKVVKDIYTEDDKRKMSRINRRNASGGPHQDQ